MQHSKQFKSGFRAWLPFGLWRIDWYYIKYYVRAFFIIIIAIIALISIGDMFQRFDDFITMARRDHMDLGQTVITFIKYYGTWVPQLAFQYMLPAAMLIAAAITVTASYAGPRGNNEYIVIRSAGIPTLRALLPLVLPALLIALFFQTTRDLYLPAMVRETSAIMSRLRSRTSNPISFSHFGARGIQTVAVGWFEPGGLAHNMILEARDAATFQRGDPKQGDNDFIAYRAALARLDGDAEGGYRWVPLENAEIHTYTRFSRRARPWTEPVPTDITPAMIERQPLGDSVSSWHDLLLMEHDDASARFEMHWRMAEPIACVILMIWGVGLCMGRMLRGKPANYIMSITIAMIAAAAFYVLRLAGSTLWESGTLTPIQGVWYPLAAAAVIAVFIALWMER